MDHNITGYILAGGQNSRMQGQVKLFLRYRGRSFGQLLQEALASLNMVYLSVSVDTPGQGADKLREEMFSALGLPLLRDMYPSIGPMGGILTGLQSLPDTPLLVVSSDVPFLREEDVKQIREAYEQKQILTLARSGDRIHPLIGIYPPTLRGLFEERVAAGDYRMLGLLSACEYQTVELPEQSTRNINSPAEYESFCSGGNS